MPMHTCKSCNQTKNFEDFPKRLAMTLGITNECKSCKKLRLQKWRIDNRDLVAKNNKKNHQTFYKKHKDDVDKKNRIWQKNNPDLVRKNARKAFKNFYHKNKQFCLDRARNGVKNLDKNYILGNISRDCGVGREKIPTKLIDAKRIFIKIVRLIKDIKNENIRRHQK